MNETQTPTILDPSGKPARTAADTACAQCGAGLHRRVLVSGFGPPQYACGACGRPVVETS